MLVSIVCLMQLSLCLWVASANVIASLRIANKWPYKTGYLITSSMNILSTSVKSALKGTQCRRKIKNSYVPFAALFFAEKSISYHISQDNSHKQDTCGIRLAQV